MQRLARSAEYFGFQAVLHQIQGELARFAAGLSSGLHRVRLLVSRLGERIISLQEVIGNPNIYLMNSIRGTQKIQIYFSEKCGGNKSPVLG
jgi:hypothetical protein